MIGTYYIIIPWVPIYTIITRIYNDVLSKHLMRNVWNDFLNIYENKLFDYHRINDITFKVIDYNLKTDFVTKKKRFRHFFPQTPAKLYIYFKWEY